MQLSLFSILLNSLTRVYALITIDLNELIKIYEL